MKAVAATINKFTQDDIRKIESEGKYTINIDGEDAVILLSEVEITSQDIPGWLVATNNNLTVALDITVTDELRYEGIAREFINRIQNLRKELNLEVTDKIMLNIKQHDYINEAVKKHKDYIAAQTLASELNLLSDIQEDDNSKSVEIENKVETVIQIRKKN